MQAIVQTGPAVEPISTAQAKTHLRITHSDDDTYIDTLIATAREYCERFTWRKLISQTWKMFLTDWPDGDVIQIPFGELQSVTHLKYKDTDGDQTTWGAANYIVDTDSALGRIVLAYSITWPTTELYPSNPIEIQFVCGYGDAGSDLPAPLIQAMKILIADYYENRENSVVGTITQKTRAAEALMLPYVLQHHYYD